MVRPIFTPVFEEAESNIRDRMIDRIGDEWRKEPGDFMYDAVAPSPLEVKQLQANQDEILKSSFAQYAEGENLDLKLSEVGLTRGQATANKRNLNVTADAGVILPAGATLSTVVLDAEGNPLEYTINTAVVFQAAGSLEVEITCKTVGEISNVAKGSEFILSPSIPGVRSITDLGTTIPGANLENDESAWLRYDFRVKNPDTGGNKRDYVRWTGGVEGVGRVKVVPRWAGNGTVKVLVVDTTYRPPSPVLVEEVQEYLDPGSMGLGEGKAPCGAQVTVAAATAVGINITANVEYYAGMEDAARATFTAAVDTYLKSIALVEIADDPNRNNVPVSIAKIGALIITTEGVSNYSGLMLNGAAVDVPVGAEEAAVLGVVSI